MEASCHCAVLQITRVCIADGGNWLAQLYPAAGLKVGANGFELDQLTIARSQTQHLTIHDLSGKPNLGSSWSKDGLAKVDSIVDSAVTRRVITGRLKVRVHQRKGSRQRRLPLGGRVCHSGVVPKCDGQAEAEG